MGLAQNNRGLLDAATLLKLCRGGLDQKYGCKGLQQCVNLLTCSPKQKICVGSKHATVAEHATFVYTPFVAKGLCKAYERSDDMEAPLQFLL